jgi:hypothetical protein
MCTICSLFIEADGDIYTLFGYVAGSWEDMRLFYDSKGDLRVLFTKYWGWEAQPKRNTMHTAKVEVEQEGDSFTVTLQPDTQLNFLDAQYAEKNWVPWNGTNMIT